MACGSNSPPVARAFDNLGSAAAPTPMRPSSSWCSTAAGRAGLLQCFVASLSLGAVFFFIDVFPRGTLAQVAGWSALWRRYSWHDWCASSGYPCSCLSRLLSRWFVSDDVLITRLLSLADTTTPRLIGCFLRLSPPHPEGAFLNLSVGRSFDH